MTSCLHISLNIFSIGFLAVSDCFTHTIKITADEMLSGIEPQRETKTQQAKDLICTLLAGGKQVLSEDIDKAALERGIPGRTVRDAKRELGDALKSKIVEGRKKVFWME